MDVFVVNFSDAKNIKPELLQGFRHKELKNKEKEKEHCFAYLMLDRILKEVYKIQNREVEFVNKKPYLKTRELFFSISHSKEYLVLCFSKSECGIDIEKITQRDFLSISKRMNFSSKTLEEFYCDWTKYEAEYKLGSTSKNIMQTKFKSYMITAVSEDSKETFEIYIQNGEEFPNL